jgi:hypothetical protein
MFGRVAVLVTVTLVFVVEYESRVEGQPRNAPAPKRKQARWHPPAPIAQ